LGLLPFRNDFFFAAALCVTWTIGEMLTFPVSMTLAIKYIGDHKKGLYMSVYHTAISISGLLFPLLGTYIYQYLSGNTLWFMCFVLSLALMFGYMFVNSARSKLPEKNPASI
jgi:MFS family permease